MFAAKRKRSDRQAGALFGIGISLVPGYAATALNILAAFDPRRRKRIKPIAVEVENHALWCEVCQA